MRRKKTESSNLASFGYLVRSKTLEIRFNNGSVYQYMDVPRDVYEELQASESKGKFFHSHIRNSYAYKKTK
jgi:hypothetical protein